jgi:serine/threonine-protein kinase
MGTVYAAIDTSSGQTVAVKVLSPLLASDPSFRERFASEIVLLDILKHPNIVQYLRHDEQDGLLYYSMELIDGCSLQDELRHGRRFTWREVTRIAVDVCAALKLAHDHGIYHRDVKPANLLYTRDEKVKLLDFGIAKVFGNTSVTTGSVMGTADYMAPEQAEGKPVGPRTDLYSLGAVMYALLSGRPPFVGKSVPEVVHKVRFERPIPVSRLANDVPVELDHLIEQLLEKNPQKRIPTALATTHRLKAMEHALSIPRDGTGRLDEFGRPPARTGVVDPNQQETVRIEEGEHDEHDVDRLTVSIGAEAESLSDRFATLTRSRHHEPSRHFPWQTLLLSLLLVAIVAAGYQGIRRAARPLTADQLYQRISERASGDPPARLSEAEKDMSQFLELYADDARVSQVKQWHEQLELDRLQRRLESPSRRRADPPSSALAGLYLEILPLVETDPELAAQRLQAMLSLYDEHDALDPSEHQYLGLARRRLRELQVRIEQQTATQRKMIQQRLETARELPPSEAARARQIYSSLIELYGDKPWATDEVETASIELQRLANLAPAAAVAEPSPPGC